MGLAEIKASRQSSVEKTLNSVLVKELREILENLETQTLHELHEQGVEQGQTNTRKAVHLKYKGTDSTIEVSFADEPKMTSDFERIHKEQFGFIMPESELVVELVELETGGGGAGNLESTKPVKHRSC